MDIINDKAIWITKNSLNYYDMEKHITIMTQYDDVISKFSMIMYMSLNKISALMFKTMDYALDL